MLTPGVVVSFCIIALKKAFSGFALNNLYDVLQSLTDICLQAGIVLLWGSDLPTEGGNNVADQDTQENDTPEASGNITGSPGNTNNSKM
ncbi:MAG: hypothetical protein PWP63_1445 [Methanolobus sp.]|jgi:hypothetical protein|nr:hypothetical protein [Methanolobus sp.]